MRGDIAKAARRARRAAERESLREAERRACHESEAAAIIILRNRAEALGRIPKKSDFGECQISQVKGALGPWPRALEKAGLKPVSESYQRKQETKRLKRRRSRRRREPAAEV